MPLLFIFLCLFSLLDFFFFYVLLFFFTLRNFALITLPHLTVCLKKRLSTEMNLTFPIRTWRAIQMHTHVVKRKLNNSCCVWTRRCCRRVAVRYEPVRFGFFLFFFLYVGCFGFPTSHVLFFFVTLMWWSFLFFSEEKRERGPTGMKLRMLYFYSLLKRPAAIYGEGEERHIPRIIRMASKGFCLFACGDRSNLVDWFFFFCAL